MSCSYLSYMISVSSNNFDGAKDNLDWQILILPKQVKLNRVLYYADCALKIAQCLASVFHHPLFKAIKLD